VNFSAILSSDSDGIIKTYEWDFGDGSNGTGESASHTYTTAGTLTVVLRVTDDDGAQDTAQKMVTVLPGEEPGGGSATGPTATFTATPLVGAAPLTVTFNASASSYEGHAITYYSWNFGDGVTGTGMTTSHTYSPATTTTYHVVLRIIASDNTEGTATKDITVTTSTPTPGTNNPTASFTTAPNKVVAPKRIICDGGNSAAVAGRTLTEWIWRFGDGTSPRSLNSDAPIQHRYTTDRASETFTVTLIVIDDEDGTDTEQRTVTVENKQPVAGFEINDELGGTGTYVADDVTFPDTGLLQTDSATVWIRSEEPPPATWEGDTPTTNDETDPLYVEPTPKTGEPGLYSDHNLSYDPEGQDWSGDIPDGFPNAAWGIEWFKIDWGDGNTEFVAYSTGLAAKDHLYTGLAVGVNNFTITVTAIDYLGAETSYSRTVTINRTS
jgi:PKD repeat protein